MIMGNEIHICSNRTDRPKQKLYSHQFITSFSHSHFIRKAINKMIRLTSQINAYHLLYEIILPVITNRMNSNDDDLCIILIYLTDTHTVNLNGFIAKNIF